MTTRWEYAVIEWWSVAERREGAGSEGWSYTTTYRIVRPGEAPEELPPRRTIIDVLNDLGAEGWELVNTTIQHSRVGEVFGWIEASSPVYQTWLLKRPTA